MSKILKLVSLVILLFLLSNKNSCCQVTSTEGQEKIKQIAWDYLKSEKYEDAIYYYNQLADSCLAEQPVDSLNWAKSKNLVGFSLRHLSKHQQSINMHEMILDWCLKNADQEKWLLATSYHHLGYNYYEMGNRKAAREYCKKR